MEQSIHSVDDEETDERLKEMDVNGDGLVTKLNLINVRNTLDHLG